jgi:5-methylcytosine-specific restriction enzyme A
MAQRPKSVCRHPRCGALVDAAGYCPAHEKEAVGWNRSHTESSQARGYGARWRKIRLAVLNRDKGLCHCDECQGGKLRVMLAKEVDHIIPKSKGGTDAMSNLRAISHECHKKKTFRER